MKGALQTRLNSGGNVARLHRRFPVYREVTPASGPCISTCMVLTGAGIQQDFPHPFMYFYPDDFAGVIRRMRQTADDIA
jgi:hypothetical protein